MTMTIAPDELHLLAIDGPEMRSFTLSGEEAAIIGRAEECAVPLADASVSRQHAAVERRGEQWFIADLGSRNGTFLNGVRLEADRAAVGGAGDYVRVGRYTFRISLGDEPTSTVASTSASVTPGTIVERIPERAFGSMAQRRLELLTEGAMAIHLAPDEAGLARVVLDVVMAGCAFERAAVLRTVGAEDRIEIIASRERRPGDGAFEFSASLLHEAASGHLARLSKDADAGARGQSIIRLGIHSALCAPIMLDRSVVGYIYLDSRDVETAGGEDGVGFCHAVSRLAGLALSSLKRAELEQRQRRMEKDINAARQAQVFLWPDLEGVVGDLRYAVQGYPGRYVAGDLFDIFAIDEHRVGICIGDVSGQGMGAAILMTAVLAHLRANLARFGDPGDAVSHLNQYITRRSEASMFVSLWAGIFDRRDRVIHYVDAGHGHWIIRRAGEAPVRAPHPGAGLIGIDPGFTFETVAIDVAPGDRIMLFSDGMVEHRNPAGDEFGRERLLEAVARTSGPSEDVHDALAALHAFLESKALADDTTIASIELIGEPG